MASHRDDFGGKTSMTLKLPRSPARPNPRTDAQRLDEAMTATALGEFETVLALLPRISNPAHSFQKRQMAIQALVGLQRHEALLDLLRPPQSPDETVRAISLLVDLKRFDEAESELETATGLLDPATAKSLTAHIAAARMLS